MQQLCKSCMTYFKFYCMFYFTCDRSFTDDDEFIAVVSTKFIEEYVMRQGLYTSVCINKGCLQHRQRVSGAWGAPGHRSHCHYVLAMWCDAGYSSWPNLTASSSRLHTWQPVYLVLSFLNRFWITQLKNPLNKWRNDSHLWWNWKTCSCQRLSTSTKMLLWQEYS